MPELTPKQRAFVEAYLSNGHNATAAYRTAYNSKMSPAATKVQAWNLLRNPKIAPVVAAAKAEATAEANRQIEAIGARYVISRANVLREMARIGFSSPRDAMTWGPQGVKLRDSGDLNDDEIAGIAEVSESMSENGRTLKLKMHPKLPALTQLGKHLGLWDQQPADDDTLANMADDASPDRVNRGKA